MISNIAVSFLQKAALLSRMLSLFLEIREKFII